MRTASVEAASASVVQDITSEEAFVVSATLHTPFRAEGGKVG